MVVDTPRQQDRQPQSPRICYYSSTVCRMGLTKYHAPQVLRHTRGTILLTAVVLLIFILL